MSLRNLGVVLILTGLFYWPIGTSTAAEDEEPSRVSLAALIDEAVAQNPSILAYRQRWGAAREEIPQATALDDPQLTITQWAIPSDFNLGDADETWYGIGQSFPFPGKRSLRGQIAEKAAEGAEQEYLATIQEITAKVKTAYYRLVLIQESIVLHVEHQELLEEFIRIANHKYAVGQASQQELLKAQVELSKLHNSLLMLEQEQLSAAAEINALLNRPMEMALGRVEAPVYHPFSLTSEEVTRHALLVRPELRAAAVMVEKSERASALAHKNYLPDFAIEVMHWDVHGSANKWQASFKMTIPWIFTGKYDARIRQVAAEEAQARAELAAVSNQTRFELRDLFTKVKTAEQLIAIYEAGVLPQAEQSLAAAQIGYQSGSVGFLDLIDSERTLLDLQLESVGARVQFWQAVTQLERSAGRTFTR